MVELIKKDDLGKAIGYGVYVLNISKNQDEVETRIQKEILNLIQGHEAEDLTLLLSKIEKDVFKPNKIVKAEGYRDHPSAENAVLCKYYIRISADTQIDKEVK